MNHVKKKLERLLSMFVVVAILLSVGTPVSAAAAEPNTPKEEVVYINLNADGSVKEINVVNIFSLDKAGRIIDYGEYQSLRNMTTTDEIGYSDSTVTIDAEAGKLYYEGKLDSDVMPWNISIRYYIDGQEYTAEEVAGMSGQLKIAMCITENTVSRGSFFDGYALQASFTLDTDICRNIKAPEATIANVGSDKQLTYTILPGKGADIEITADVTDFEMSAVSINGIHLNLNVEIDDEELKDKVNELIDAVEQLDDGAKELSDGTGELLDGTSGLKDGASSLHSGIASLDEGVVTLQNGLNTIQSGLDSLNSQSATLRNGSAKFKSALVTLQTAVNSISVTNEDLTELASASGQIKQAICDLNEGAAALQENLGFAQYKALMAQNGLNIDDLIAGNSSAVEMIREYEGLLEQLGNVPGLEGIVSQYKSQLTASAEQIIALLNANNAAIGGMESYLNGISAELPALTNGLSELNTQYETFDTAIGTLVNSLGNMTGNLSALAEGINQLVDSYEELDSGIGNYTGGVAQIVAGYSQVVEGVPSLAQGSKELVSGSNELYDGTIELYDGVISLCDGAQEMSEGTGEFREETSNMNEQMEEEIDSLLESIGGSMEDPVSFASEKNTNVDSVQFVIQTSSVKIAEEDVVEVESDATLNFWQKFLRLFGLY